MKSAARFGDEFAHLDFFVVGEKGGFVNDFEDFVAASLFVVLISVFHIT